MRNTVVAVGVGLVLFAAYYSVREALDPFNGWKAAAAVVLLTATLARNLSALSKMITARSRKREAARSTAEETLIEICRDLVVDDKLVEAAVHVWSVPAWYRKIFPHWFRLWLCGVSESRKFRFLKDRKIRPRLERFAVSSFLKRGPSGIKFSKGRSVIDVCLENNVHGRIVTLDTTDIAYQNLLVGNEQAWSSADIALTRGLSQNEARRLAERYGYVCAAVIRSKRSDEALGCVTFSFGPEITDDMLRALPAAGPLRKAARTLSVLLE